MREITLQNGMKAQVDDEDYERVNALSWRAKKKYGRASWYAYSTISSGSSPSGRVDVAMHRFILDTPSNLQTDHIDNNGLNNQKKNLRIATLKTKRTEASRRTTSLGSKAYR